MTVEALMTETVTVERPTGEFTQSASGDPTPLFDDLGSTTMYLEPLNIRTTIGEAREIGYVPLGDWLGIGTADFGWDSHDRITWTRTRVRHRVTPACYAEPLTAGTQSHTEMDLQLIGQRRWMKRALADSVGGF